MDCADDPEQVMMSSYRKLICSAADQVLTTPVVYSFLNKVCRPYTCLQKASVSHLSLTWFQLAPLSTPIQRGNIKQELKNLYSFVK